MIEKYLFNDDSLKVNLKIRIFLLKLLYCVQFKTWQKLVFLKLSIKHDKKALQNERCNFLRIFETNECFFFPQKTYTSGIKQATYFRSNSW